MWTEQQSIYKVDTIESIFLHVLIHIHQMQFKMVSFTQEQLEELNLKYPETYIYNVNINNSRGGGAMIYVPPYKSSVYGLQE